MKSFTMSWWGCGAFDVVFEDMAFAFDPYLFGEALEQAASRYAHIFISHEHFDHCHVKTLRRLCRGERFQSLYVNPGCVWPNEPIEQNYGDAAFARDLPITKHISPDRIKVVYPKYYNKGTEHRGWETELPLKELPCLREGDLGAITFEAIESGENQRGDLPTCGYFVRHKLTGVSFLHIGDLWKVYPQLEQLRDRVDFLLHMKLGLKETGGADHSEELKRLLNLVRPKYLIPLHYRTDRISDPVPIGHWPPNVTDVFAYIESLRETAGDLTQVVPFTAGVRYEVLLPELKVQWRWNWYNTWDIPPWRTE